MYFMWKVVWILSGDFTNLHYNFVVAKPLVLWKGLVMTKSILFTIILEEQILDQLKIVCVKGPCMRFEVEHMSYN